MPFLLVSSLSGVEKTIERYHPSHLVTLLSPEFMIETPHQIAFDRHLRLALNDVAEAWEGASPPSIQHIEKLIAFGRSWDAYSPMLVHCYAGISRSMAAAYTICVIARGPATNSPSRGTSVSAPPTPFPIL